MAAAHLLVDGDGVHLEDAAMQSLGLPSVEGTDPVPPLRSELPPTDTAEQAASTVTALADAPRIDVASVVDAAATAAQDAAREDAARRTAPPARPASGRGETGRSPSSCPGGTDGFGPVADGVAEAGEQLRCMFSVDTVFGVAGRSNASDHPAGKALDFMVDRVTGDRLAGYALANRERLGIKYVIYRQRIDTGDGWEPMPDRGSAVANHMDHVHISFD